LFKDEALGLLIVADGMGGHAAGEVASRLAVEAVTSFIRRTSEDQEHSWPYGIDSDLSFNANRLRTAVHLANRRVFREAENHDDYTGMGTTIVAALVANGTMSIAHVGDSRMYLAGNGQLVQLTRDDSWAATVLGQSPLNGAAPTEQHPMRHVLTNVLGARDNTEIHMQERKIGRARSSCSAPTDCTDRWTTPRSRKCSRTSRRRNGRRRRWCVRRWTGAAGTTSPRWSRLARSDGTRGRKPACGTPGSGLAATRSSTGLAVAAMGVVYSAHDELMEREVAVKVMMTDLEGEPDIRARFMREAQVSAKLAHRNIVTIFDVGEDNGRLFIVMELLKGDTLDKSLKQRSFSIEEKVDLTLEVCEGLAVAERGRGVPPRRETRQPVRSDGRRSEDPRLRHRQARELEHDGQRFHRRNPRLHVAGAGARRGGGRTVRHLLGRRGALPDAHGQETLRCAGPAAVLHKVVSEDPPPIEAKDAPPALARIVFKALSKDAAARFQKFPEFSAELSRWRRRYDAENPRACRTSGNLARIPSGFRIGGAGGGQSAWRGARGRLQLRLSEIAAGYPQLLANGADAAAIR
jgi:hypothetical protein